MGLRPFRLSVENFSDLAGLEVKLGQTWSQNSPDMVTKSKTPETFASDHVDSVLKISDVQLMWK